MIQVQMTFRIAPGYHPQATIDQIKKIEGIIIEDTTMTFESPSAWDRGGFDREWLDCLGFVHRGNEPETVVTKAQQKRIADMLNDRFEVKEKAVTTRLDGKAIEKALDGMKRKGREKSMIKPQGEPEVRKHLR